MKRCSQISMEPQLSLKLFHEDRITNLDENLLSQILSRLTAKDVVRTCILSKGWRYKWTTSYNMSLIDTEGNWNNDQGSIVEFINRILFYTQHPTSFRLKFQRSYGVSRLQEWISSALKHRLEVLELWCCDRGIVIPCSLLNSTRLQELILRLDQSTLNVAAMNYAPNLTSLLITGVDIVNENHNTSNTVKFDFPLLETLTLTHFKWLNVKSVEVYAPSLTTFSSAPRCQDEYDYSVVINAPRLATFECGSYIPEKIILDGSSIVSANFNCRRCKSHSLELLANIGIRVRNLLNEFKNLEVLRLTTFMIEVSQLGPPLQDHHKLRQLLIPHRINGEQLIQLLHAAPSLKILKAQAYNWPAYDYEAIELVPTCIVSHLEEVEFSFFCSEYNLLKFLCVNGEKLKKLTFSDLSRKKRSQVKKFVSAFRNVELEFRPCPSLFFCNYMLI